MNIYEICCRVETGNYVYELGTALANYIEEYFERFYIKDKDGVIPFYVSQRVATEHLKKIVKDICYSDHPFTNTGYVEGNPFGIYGYTFRYSFYSTKIKVFIFIVKHKLITK